MSNFRYCVKLTQKNISFVIIFLLTIIVMTGCGSTKNKENTDDSSNSETQTEKNGEYPEAEVQSILDDFNEGNITHTEALNKISEYGETFPSKIIDARNTLKQLNDSKKAFSTGSTKYESEEYTEAILELRKVVEKDINYDEAQTLLKEAENKYLSVVFEQIDAYIAEHKFDKAIALVNDANNYVTFDSECNGVTFDSKLTEIHTSQSEYEAEQKTAKEDEAAALAASGSYLEAVAVYQELFDTYNDQVYKVKIEGVENSMINDSISAAEELLAQKKFDEAVGTALKYEFNVPDASELYAEVERIESYRPVDMTTMDSFYEDGDVGFKSRAWQKDDVDNTGRDGNVGFRYSMTLSGDGMYYADYLLDGKYDSLSGEIVLGSEHKNTASICYFNIYCDGVKKYSSEKITGGTLPISVSLNVKGVSKVRFESKFVYGGNPYKDFIGVGFVNPLLYKEIKPLQ